jgi:hypothetical protein
VVRAGATWRGFDAQRKTGGVGRSTRIVSQQMERAAKLQDLEVRAERNRRVRGCERECSAGGRLGLIPQACAHARQQATREQVESQWCESRTGTTRRRCDRARRSCRRLRGCADRVSAAHAREQWRLSREQENPVGREGVGIANQSGLIGFFHESTTSSSSYPSPIVRARPQHLRKAREPSYRASSDPFVETSSPW